MVRPNNFFFFFLFLQSSMHRLRVSILAQNPEGGRYFMKVDHHIPASKSPSVSEAVHPSPFVVINSGNGKNLFKVSDHFGC